MPNGYGTLLELYDESPRRIFEHREEKKKKKRDDKLDESQAIRHFIHRDFFKKIGFCSFLIAPERARLYFLCILRFSFSPSLPLAVALCLLTICLFQIRFLFVFPMLFSDFRDCCFIYHLK